MIPVTKDPGNDMLVTQLDMKWVEPAGLVKFDFLALKTLTVLQRTEEFINANGGNVSLAGLPLDDKKTYEMLSRADVTGVFQLESSGMRDVLRSMKPDRFEDIIALVALYRPGPMADIPRYIACKQGTEEVSYAHPVLEPILEPNLWRDRLSGAGLADRQGSRRLQSRPGRYLAQCDGQEDQVGDGQASASALSRARLGAVSPRRRPRISSRRSRNSPVMASTNRTRRLMRWSPIKPLI